MMSAAPFLMLASLVRVATSSLDVLMKSSMSIAESGATVVVVVVVVGASDVVVVGGNVDVGEGVDV